MIALRLRFPAGRYHATPWGRHVNEAAIAWPPEPLRILRALIACHHRKADRTRFTDESLADLIDALAPQLPVYRLPEAVHAHTRHYMPAPVKTTLVFDAFARFDPQEPLIVGWPGAALSSELCAHLEHLAARLGYLGRAESWVEAEVIDWDGEGANARPLHGDRNNTRSNAGDTDHRLTSVYAPLSPSDYRQCREKLVAEERERRRAGWTKKAQPTVKVIENDMKDFLATLPERLACALAIDTSDLHAVGWSDPPAARRVLYAAPEPATAWRGERLRQATRKRPDPTTVARFVLAGRPRPRVEDTVRIAEIMRLAAMAKFGWTVIDGKRRPNAPSVISGYGDDGKPLRDDGHAHAFWLPEDADGDGEIDHIVVYAPAGLDGDCRKTLDLVTKLWIEKRARDDEDEAADGGRKEWRLALEGFGHPKDFAAANALFGSSKTWISTTPYLMPWHAKKGFGWAEQIARELEERGLPSLAELPRELCSIPINGRERRPLHFHRFRSRHGLRQPDTLGRFLELTFKVPLEGPLALGFGCHFGLGLFASVNLPAE
jgi:CRISPR-associated protein Csb2